MFTHRKARGLGWFGIAMGVAQMLMARSAARKMRLSHRPGHLGMSAMGEMATGVGLLRRRNRGQWTWGRVAGNLMNFLTLRSAFGRHSRGRGRIGATLAAVAGVTALDVLARRRMGKKNRPFNYVI